MLRGIAWTLVAVAVVGLAACSDNDNLGFEQAQSPQLEALHAAPDAVNGGRIVDAAGREVLLRGVNVNSLGEYWKGTAFEPTYPFGAWDADQIASIGWNVVRLVITWSRVEPQPGVYDESYLDKVASAVALLEARGVYSLVDFHQDAWGPTLAAPAGTVCSEGSIPAFGWDGAPGWATLDGGAVRCAIGGVRELSPAVEAAWQAFWTNAPGPGGIGIRTRYAEMVGHVAGRFAHSAAVAGYDLMNEPNAFDLPAYRSMSAMYGDAIQAIRANEQSAGGFPHLVFFEPSAIWSEFGRGAPHDFERDANVVYAPHPYSGPVSGSMFTTAIHEAQRFDGAPVFAGEWGTDPHKAYEPGRTYFIEYVDWLDQFHLGSALWLWIESCGDPHEGYQFRAGNQAHIYGWGLFDMNCLTNEIASARVPLWEQMTRGYVRAAPGRLGTMRWDHFSGVLDVDGSDARPGTELVIFYPASKRGTPVVEATGLGAVRLDPAPGGNLYLRAGATASRWSLQASPR